MKIRAQERGAKRALGLLHWLAPLAFCGVVLAWLSQPGNRPGVAEGNDFVVYYDGTAGFGPTGNPYGTGFVSPAPLAVLLLPLTWLPVDTAAGFWFALSLAALGTLSAAALHVARLPVAPASVFALMGVLFLWPSNNHGLLLGQNSVVAAALATLAVAAAGFQPALAGALLAVGAVMKPHLVIVLALGLALVEFRRERSLTLAGSFLLAAIGLVGVTALYSRRWIDVLMASPPESWNYWGSTIGTNVFLAAVLEDQGAGWFLLAVLGASLATGLLVWWRRASPSFSQFASALLAATLLLTPYAYPHDYVMLVLPLVWLTAALWRRRGVLALPAVFLMVAIAWVAPMPARYDDARFVALMVPTIVLAATILVGAGPAAESGNPEAEKRVGYAAAR